MRTLGLVGLGIVGFVLIALLIGTLLVPVPPLAGTVEAARLADADSRFVDVPLGSDTLTVHYKEAGDSGRALVLLHGFGASLFSWREVMAPLAETNRVVAFDRPAFGLTERPLRETWGTAADWAAGLPYSALAQADLAIAMLDARGIDRAVLVGNSAGGAVAMLAALEHPERVDALVLISPAVYSGGPNGAMQWLLNTPQMQHIGPLIARRIQGWGDEFARSAWHDPDRITEAVWQGYLAPLHIENWDRALWELTAASRQTGLADRLAALQLPVLVITGDDDRIVPTEQSVKLAGALPNAELAVIPACGHVAHEECSQATLEVMTAFLNQLKP